MFKLLGQHIATLVDAARRRGDVARGGSGRAVALYLPDDGREERQTRMVTNRRKLLSQPNSTLNAVARCARRRG